MLQNYHFHVGLTPQPFQHLHLLSIWGEIKMSEGEFSKAKIIQETMQPFWVLFKSSIFAQCSRNITG